MSPLDLKALVDRAKALLPGAFIPTDPTWVRHARAAQMAIPELLQAIADQSIELQQARAEVLKLRCGQGIKCKADLSLGAEGVP